MSLALNLLLSFVGPPCLPQPRLARLARSPTRQMCSLPLIVALRHLLLFPWELRRPHLPLTRQTARAHLQPLSPPAPALLALVIVVSLQTGVLVVRQGSLLPLSVQPRRARPFRLHSRPLLRSSLLMCGTLLSSLTPRLAMAFYARLLLPPAIVLLLRRLRPPRKKMPFALMKDLLSPAPALVPMPRS